MILLLLWHILSKKARFLINLMFSMNFMHKNGRYNVYYVHLFAKIYNFFIIVEKINTPIAAYKK